jgi:hypothetical protein
MDDKIQSFFARITDDLAEPELNRPNFFSVLKTTVAILVHSTFISTPS